MFNYNTLIQTTQYYLDIPNKMILSKPYNWNPGGDGNKGDALGRSLEGWFIYGDPQLIEGAKNCWKKIECDPDYEDCSKWKYYYKGYRYPTPEFFKKDMSRDHTSNTISLMALAGEDEWLKDLVTHLRWVITDSHVNSKGKKIGRHSFTPALWGWAKALGGKWWGRLLFYPITFFELIMYIIINNLCYLLGWIGPEVHQDDYDAKTMSKQKQSKWRQFWIGLTYPMFALNLMGWQLYVNEVKEKTIIGKLVNRFLQIIAYLLIGKHNYLHKLMFNVGKVTKEDVLGYKPMKGGRWTTPLNECNDRDVHIIKDPELLVANVIDSDILIKFWNIRHPEDQIV